MTMRCDDSAVYAEEEEGKWEQLQVVQGDVRRACASTVPFRILYENPDFYSPVSSFRTDENGVRSAERPQILRPPSLDQLRDPSLLRRCGKGCSSLVFRWLPEADDLPANDSSHQAYPSWCIKKVELQDQPPPHDVFTEIRALASVKHENIVELLAASEEETDPFTDVTSLLMPYYPLGLLDLLQDVSIIPTELHVAANLQATTTMTSIQAYLGIALSIASQLFQALHYLHEKAHIAHRDIKPLNVRLVPIVQDLQPAPSSYVLKLIDFGTATFLDQPQTASHTPSSNADFRSKTTAVCSGVFRAPELLFSPLDGYDPRGIDIWAGACVISMFLTAFTVVRKEADRRADDEEIFGRGSDDGSEHGEALKLDAEEQSGAVSTRHPTARTDEPKELEATEQQMAPAVILPPSLRRKSLFDLERVSDIPLAANIFELKGLPSDVAEWPEAARYNPRLDRMPFARTPPSSIYTRLPLASELERIGGASPAASCVTTFVELIDACTALSASSRPTPAQVVDRLSRATEILYGLKE